MRKRRAMRLAVIAVLASALIGVTASSGTATVKRSTSLLMVQSCPLQQYMTVCARLYYIRTDSTGPLYQPVVSMAAKSGYAADGISGDAHEVIGGDTAPEGSCYSSGSSCTLPAHHCLNGNRYQVVATGYVLIGGRVQSNYTTIDWTCSAP